MKLNEKQKLGIALVVIIGLVTGGIYYYSQRKVKPKTTVSEFDYWEYQYPDKTNTGDTGTTDATIKGYLTCTLSADEWQRNTFVVDSSDLRDLSVPADKSEGISPGSEIRFKGGISVITAPTDEGVYYVDYDVMKRYNNYYETGKYQSGATRQYAYYEIASDGAWDERNIPFRVKVEDSETGETISNWSKYVVGPQGNEEQISLAEGIELEKLGQLGTGMKAPGTEYVYGTRVKNGSLESFWFNKGSFKSAINNIGGTTLNKVRIDEGGVSCDAGNDYIVINQSGDVKAETTGGAINNGANRFQFKESGDELSSVWSWTVDEGHQDLDLVIPLNVNASGINPSDVSVNLTYTNNPQNDSPSEHFHWKDKDPSDGKIKIKLDEGGWWGVNSNPTVEVTFNFKPGRIDTLSKFSRLTDLGTVNTDTTPSAHIATSSSELVSSNFNLWTPQPLYSSPSAELPETSYSDTELDSPVVWTTDHNGNPIIQLRAPLDQFDAVLYTPQYTNPTVDSITPSPLEITGGKEKTVQVQVANNGYTDGSMRVSYRTPSWAYISSGPEKVNVKKGESRTFTYSIVSTADKEAREGDITFTFSGVESGKEGSGSITVKSTPPTHTITTEVNPSGAGSISLDPDKNEYVEGETVTVEAVPSDDAEFTGWGGDISPSDPNPTDITVTSDLKIIAYFGTPPPGYQLDVNIEPSAGGSVTREPSQSSYEEGTEVTLTAKPSSGYNFVNWSGDVDGVSNTSSKVITLTMNSYREITANFVEEKEGRFTITTSAIPRDGGSVYLSPSKTSYKKGEQVAITALPQAGYKFDHWTGDLSGTSSTKTITINSNIEATAVFTTTLPWTTIIIIIVAVVAGVIPLTWWRLR